MEQVERRERQGRDVRAQHPPRQAMDGKCPEAERHALHHQQRRRVADDREQRRDQRQPERRVGTQQVEPRDRAVERSVQEAVRGLHEDREVEVGVAVVAELDQREEREHGGVERREDPGGNARAASGRFALGGHEARRIPAAGAAVPRPRCRVAGPDLACSHDLDPEHPTRRGGRGREPRLRAHPRAREPRQDLEHLAGAGARSRRDGGHLRAAPRAARSAGAAHRRAGRDDRGGGLGHQRLRLLRGASRPAPRAGARRRDAGARRGARLPHREPDGA